MYENTQCYYPTHWHGYLMHIFNSKYILELVVLTNMSLAVIQLITNIIQMKYLSEQMCATYIVRTQASYRFVFLANALAH